MAPASTLRRPPAAAFWTAQRPLQRDSLLTLVGHDPSSVGIGTLIAGTGCQALGLARLSQHRRRAEPEGGVQTDLLHRRCVSSDFACYFGVSPTCRMEARPPDIADQGWIWLSRRRRWGGLWLRFVGPVGTSSGRLHRSASRKGVEGVGSGVGGRQQEGDPHANP
jgi:hypothetical protein